MGVCFSQQSTHVTGNKISNKLREQTNTNPISSKETNNTLTLNDSLLSDQWCKKDEISKYYTIDSSVQIGKGASSVVYKGRNSSQKQFAIKQISKGTLKAKNFLLTEAEISLSLDHKHIIKCYEIFEDQSTISFVLELIDGGDLFDYILSNPNGLLKDETVIELIIQILDAINYLHNIKGIVHRDIKPENFLVQLNEDGFPTAKLIDFGFACKIPTDKPLTQYMGTPLYSSPELTNRDPYNEKIDIWAAGIVFFNLLSGCHPFKNNTPVPIEEQIISLPISFDSIKNKHLKSLCMHLLERDVEKRFSAKKALDSAIEIKRLFEKESDENKVKLNDYTAYIKILSQNIGIQA